MWRKKVSSLKTLIVLVLLLRLALSFLPPMAIDQSCWRAWSARMAELGPAKFYSTEVFTDNPPGFLYVFWFLGEVKNLLLPHLSFYSSGFDFLLKLPNNLADLATGLIIYFILKKKLNSKWAKAGFLLYTLNPAIWFNSSVFGQFDGSGTLFAVLAVYALVEMRRMSWAATFFAISWAIKPQAIALAPVLGIMSIKEIGEIRGVRERISKTIKTAAAFVLTTLLLYWPFFPSNPLAGFFYVNERMTKIFTCTTCFTFNFWGLWGNWQNDASLFLGLPLIAWGMILLGLSLVLIFFGRPLLKRYSEPYLYLTIALSIMAFFNFSTRMHERYVFPFFAFFLLAALLLRSRKLILFYLFYSLFNTLNVYFPYATYTTDLHLTPNLLSWLSENFKWFSGIGFTSFLILLLGFWRIISLPIKPSNSQKT